MPLKFVRIWRGSCLSLAVCLIAAFAVSGHAADLYQPDPRLLPAADIIESQGTKPNRSCTENCMAQCRAAESSCSGERSSCRAQFQICARRCVVSCGSR